MVLIIALVCFAGVLTLPFPYSSLVLAFQWGCTAWWLVSQRREIEAHLSDVLATQRRLLSKIERNGVNLNHEWAVFYRVEWFLQFHRKVLTTQHMKELIEAIDSMNGALSKKAYGR